MPTIQQFLSRSGLMLSLLLFTCDHSHAQATPSASKRAGVVVESSGGTAKPADSKDSDGKDAKSEDKKSDESKKEEGDESKTVQRPPAPSEPSNLDEQNLELDEKKTVRFNFSKAPWTWVLGELARVSDMSLDWQELPGDALDLKTQDRYTVPEARDLINRLLLARGFTMLNKGETLSVVNIKKLDRGLVPRVRPADLPKRDSNEFVKVSFPLVSLLAETAAEELKPLLSPNGQLTPLKTTNRLEAIDSVVNLRELHAFLQEEQSHDEGGRQRGLVRQFPLQHIRAADVVDQLYRFLGIEKETGPKQPKTPQQLQMEMQMAQMRAKDPKALPAEKEIDVFLVVDARNNSILANAPPDKLAMIEQAIELLDVPSSRPSLLTNPNRMQIYRLATLDPEVLVNMLETVGNLDPETTLQVDQKNRAILADASLADHLTIRTLLGKSDGSERQFFVIPLRKLQADYVALTIQAMMSPEEKETGRRRYYYYYRQEDQEDQNKGKFRVQGDVQFNRLLIWANDIEYQEVENLLVKLGEMPPEGGNPSTLRVIDTMSDEDAQRLLERIRRAWPAHGPNKLLIDPSQRERKKSTDEEREEKTEQQQRLQKPGSEEESPARAELLEPTPASRSAVAKLDLPNRLESNVAESPNHAWRLAGLQTLLAQAEADDDTPDDSNTRGDRVDSADGLAGEAPISITRGADGRIIIGSQDTQALDQIEELMRRLSPPPKEYEIFTLKYASAYWISFTLEEFFKDEEESDTIRRPYWYYWDYDDSSNDSSAIGLAQRRPLRFISEDDSNTIVVQGADRQQLRTIRELIELYDKPIPANAESSRQTKIMYLKYAKATEVSEVIKDVFRDLLSSNDKALQQHNETMQKGKQDRGLTYIDVFGVDAPEERTQVTFKGKLSVGVHELSNAIVVSAQKNLLPLVENIVNELDEDSKPEVPTFRVLQVDRNTNVTHLQQRLKELIAKPAKPVGEDATTLRPAENGENGSRSPSTSNGNAYGR